MSSSASGADAGSARDRREHNQGNQTRGVTPEQTAAVLRIRKCSPTAFYDILGLEATRSSATESDIKKAYRKQSLLTHPDKNPHEHADEAFKMVSRAFSILGDKEKRDKFDRFGTDPDSRFANAQAQNPFSGFAQPGGGGARPGMNPGFGGFGDAGITPEELFQQFFGGGGGGFGGPFGGFDAGPQFMFNFGGGPGGGFRVHQFGGRRPRRRPNPTDPAAGQRAPQSSPLQTLLGLLPIIFFFIIPLLSNLFSGVSWGDGGSGASTPHMVFDTPVPPLTHQRSTPRFGVSYYVDPNTLTGYNAAKLKELDRAAETLFVRATRNECSNEMGRREQLMYDAQGWFFDDKEKMAAARRYKTPSCDRLAALGLGR
ncbi:hypothetical protein TD95_004515 [Thielaviopsis punctulata]|uniref:J domain-containing protein n=1 Tax=Thielaviopsis punctulata TaxID=72032 RepID=A0A0F4ZIV1_9PEZI|nr:hypothetical protein TD95_004515 [Thielaviopsis punctulata]